MSQLIQNPQQRMDSSECSAVTSNDPKLVDEMLPVVHRVLGQANVIFPGSQMGPEDFSYCQRVIPGFFFILGVGNSAKGITAMVHTPEFDVDEESLVAGVKVMANVLVDHLEPRASP